MADLRTVLPLLGLAVAISLSASSGECLAAPIVVEPAGLNVGDSYRIAFQTSYGRNANLRTIDAYNQFVTDVAEAIPELAALETEWRIIGSTDAVDARDNTDTNSNVWAGVAIYLLDGSLIADDNLDLWDGGINRTLGVTELGGNRGNQTRVWTGTEADGTAAANGHTLNSGGLVRTGNLQCADGDNGLGCWITGFGSAANQTSNEFRMYAISGVLTATVPEPSTALLMGFGLAAMGGLGNKRRRVRRITEGVSSADF